MTQGKTQAEGVCALLRQSHRFLVPRQPLIRIAKNAQRPRSKTLAHHASVLAIEEGRGTVLLEIVERYPLRKVCLCRGDRAHPEYRRP